MTEQIPPERELLPETRIECVLSFAFRGIHHAGNIKKHAVTFWETNVHGTFSTFDNDVLTRIVLAAHRYAVRVEIGNGGPHRLKLKLHARQREGFWHESHPTIAQVIEGHAQRLA